MNTLCENPLDIGLTIADWAEHDPDGYTRAIGECVSADYVALACDTLENAAGWWKGELERRMNEKLSKQVNDSASWIDGWFRKFDQG